MHFLCVCVCVGGGGGGGGGGIGGREWVKGREGVGGRGGVGRREGVGGRKRAGVEGETGKETNKGTRAGRPRRQLRLLDAITNEHTRYTLTDCAKILATEIACKCKANTIMWSLINTKLGCNGLLVLTKATPTW